MVKFYLVFAGGGQALKKAPQRLKNLAALSPAKSSIRKNPAEAGFSFDLCLMPVFADE